jgi:hypothetical protein
MRRSMRLIAVLLVVGAVGFGASAAMGTTGSAVAGAVGFSATLPDTATAGQSLNYSNSFVNNTAANVGAQYSLDLSGPGVHYARPFTPLSLRPHQSMNRNGVFALPSRVPAGLYTLTITVKQGGNTASTSATTTVSAAP